MVFIQILIIEDHFRYNRDFSISRLISQIRKDLKFDIHLKSTIAFGQEMNTIRFIWDFFLSFSIGILFKKKKRYGVDIVCHVSII